MKQILETERLYLRQLEPGDESELVKIFCHRVSMKYYPEIFSREEVRNWIERNIESYKKNNHGLWAVIIKKENIFLGDCGITIQDIDSEKLPELGYHIKKEYWNNGYATEAAGACITYAFNTLHINQLYSYTRFDNLQSVRVAEKNGMRFVKYFTKDVKGVTVKEVLYCIQRQDHTTS